MRMIGVAALTFLAMLGGCAAQQGGVLGYCETQAERSPAVKAQVLSSVSNPYYMSRHSDLIAATKAQAVQDCLRRQGVTPSGGGVERQAPTNQMF